MTVYYVDAATGNDSNSGTSTGSPWLTIQKAANTVAAGDEVQIRAGTYDEFVTVSTSGTSGNVITFKNYPSESPVIGRTGPTYTNASSIYKRQFQIEADYITIDGLTISYCGGRGIGSYLGDNITLKNLTVHHTWMDGIHIQDGDTFLVEDCEVYETRRYEEDDPANAIGAIGIVGREATNMTVRRCTVRECWGEGIAGIKGSRYFIVEDCVVYDTRNVSIYWSNAWDHIFRRNLVYHTPGSSSRWKNPNHPSNCFSINDEYEGQGFGNDYTTNSKAYNNIFMGGGHCLLMGKEDPSSGPRSCEIVNNLFLNAHATSGGDVSTIAWGAGVVSNTIFANNIIAQYDTSAPMTQGSSFSGFTFHNNCWSEQPPDGIWNNETNSIVDNPDLVNQSATLVAGSVDTNNYQLTSVSPCKDTGSNSYPDDNKDFYGGSRPVNTTNDIGHHEFNSGGTSPPTASISATPTSGDAPLTVTLTNNSTGTIDTHDWDFGDGQSSSAQSPGTHQYTSPGVYTIIYTATNTGGSDSDTETITVTDSGAGGGDSGNVGTGRANANTSTGNQSIPITGMTAAPTACLFLWTWATGTATPRSDALIGVGATDGTNQWVATASTESGANPTDTYRYGSATKCISIIDPETGTAVGEATIVSLSQSEVTINWTNAPPAGIKIGVVAFDALNAQTGTITPDADENDTISESCGFRPQIIFMASPGKTMNDTGAATCLFSDGIVVDQSPLFQACHMVRSADAASESQMSGILSSNYAAGQCSTSGVVEWAVEIALTATGFDATTREGGASFKAVGYLAMKFDSLSVFGEIANLPTGDGTYSRSGYGFTPGAVFAHVSKLLADDTPANDFRAEVWGLGAFTEDGEVSISVYDEDAIFPVNSQSLNDQKGINMPAPVIDGHRATLTSMNEDGFSLNVEQHVAGTTRGIFWAVEGSGSGPVEINVAFSGTPTGGSAPLIVDFTDESTVVNGTITGRSWKVNGIEFSTIANPQYEFVTPGNYNITLEITVSDSSTASLTKTDYIVVFALAGTSSAGIPGPPRLAVRITDGPGGAQLADFSEEAKGLRFRTNEHGMADMDFYVPMQLHDAFSVYNWPGTPHAEIATGAGQIIYNGRLEDISIRSGRVALAAFGYWRALGDVPYTALWSSTAYRDWDKVTDDDVSTAKPSMFQVDNNNRLFVALKKDEVYAQYDFAGLYMWVPDGGERGIAEVDFSYDLLASSDYQARLVSYQDDFTSLTEEWTLTGNGSSQTGSTTVTLTAARPIVLFMLYKLTAGTDTYTGDTGDDYLKITGLRVRTTTADTVLASDIVASIATYINGINSSQLLASTTEITATTTDLKDILYEDDYPDDILDDLALLHGCRAAVWLDQKVTFAPYNSAGRVWLVDVDGLEVQRSLDNVRNSAYARYKANGRDRRTAVSDDDDSQNRFNIVRRAAVKVSTTDQTEAEAHRDVYLADRADFAIRAKIKFDRLYDESGGEHPLYMIRADDTIIMRNLPPTLSSDIDNIRTFRVGETEYNAETGRIDVRPDVPTPTLVTMVARKRAGIED